VNDFDRNDFDKSVSAVQKSMGEVFDWVGGALYQGCKSLLQDVEEISLEVEAKADELLAPLYDWLDDLDDVINDTGRPFVQTVSPVLQDHPACVGCAHYHGETYGETFLVCAMHPYGVEGRNCLDWESVWNRDSHE
jgi:hypothetical protein